MRTRKLLVCVNVTLLLASVLVTPANAKPPASPALPQIPEATKGRIQSTFLRAPLHFETNVGQTEEQVKFLARGLGYQMFLTSTEAVLVLNKASGIRQQAVGKAKGTRQQAIEGSDSALSPQHSALQSVVRMKLVGANPNAEAMGSDQLPGKVNYFIGNDPKKWRTNLPTYNRVEYKAVYPGINLVFYGNQRQLEYDFVVSAGADPKAIKIAFEGPEKIEIDTHGDLILRTALRDLRLHKPLVYQEIAGIRKQISGSYVDLGLRDEVFKLKTQHSKLKTGNHLVGFQIASYDSTKPLIIDPVLSYSTYLGGSGQDDGLGIAVDSSGNAYVIGVTSSTDFPTASPLQATFGGGDQDAFVTKFNAAGSALVYSTYLGGSDHDFSRGIAVDPSGNAYVTGRTASTDFPTASPLQAANGGGAGDAFVAKLNATGSALVYSTYLGGNGDDIGTGIAVDSSGNAYVTGVTSSTDFRTASPLQATYGGGTNDAFVTKLNAAGSALVYSTYLGGSGPDRGDAIAVDGSGNVYITGPTGSTNFPTANPLQPTFGGGPKDAFVAKINASGTALVYSTYLGGSGDEHASGIAVDTSGSAYVGGFTASTDFPTASPLQATYGGGTHDAFVTKLNAAGSALVYSTYLGGSDCDNGGVIAVDSLGNAYVAGTAHSTNFPTASPVQPAFGGGINDAFVAKVNPAGSALIYSTYLGGDSGEGVTGIAVDSSGNAYVTGVTGSSDFPTASPLQATFGGTADAFVAKITDILQVTIDIKPGSFPNSINLKSKGTVAVAILGTPIFDVDEVAVNTIMFAGASLVRFSFEDVNLDGNVDLVFHFRTQDLQLSETDTEAVLEGKTSDGTPIRGTDSVRVVP